MARIKTFAVSEMTYRELVGLKDELNTRSMDKALEKLIENYKRLLKELSKLRLLQLSGRAKKASISELIKDRGVYGWPRNFY